jgi:beta-lactamase class A
LLRVHRQTAAAGLAAATILTLCACSAGSPATANVAKPTAEKRVTVARRRAKTVTTHAAATPAAAAQAMAAMPVVKMVGSAAQQALTAAVAPLARADDGQVAVTVDDLTTGTEAAYGGTQEFVTASIVKADILATLLYQAQRSGQPLSSQDQALATTMIENSDNDAASDLYDDVGGAGGVDRANQVFGLTGTTAGTSPTWGLTSTTTDDQVQLLRLMFTQPSVLTDQSQDYIQGLMSHVETDQQWGVPAAADDGSPFLVKNGWLPDPTTGLWEINSIGQVFHDGQRMLIAVLSEGNDTEDSGISLVESVAQTAAGAMAAARG